MRARVGEDLPVVRKGLAFGEVSDEDSCKGYGEGDAYDEEESRVAILAGQGGQADEKLEGDDFEEPQAGVRVKNGGF